MIGGDETRMDRGMYSMYCGTVEMKVDERRLE